MIMDMIWNILDHPCRCGSDNCIGYIVRQDQWGEVRKLLRKHSQLPTYQSELGLGADPSMQADSL